MSTDEIPIQTTLDKRFLSKWMKSRCFIVRKEYKSHWELFQKSEKPTVHIFMGSIEFWQKESDRNLVFAY